jgi:hypothetical protein
MSNHICSVVALQLKKKYKIEKKSSSGNQQQFMYGFKRLEECFISPLIMLRLQKPGKSWRFMTML